MELACKELPLHQYPVIIGYTQLQDKLFSLPECPENVSGFSQENPGKATLHSLANDIFMLI